ncbi:uncharacterized protein LOC131689013 [Topomyia yanbarensis]|uniref:uncharacterized protein LOC131689013 n=1 Tax=Topomyia yanbarensis TaxID=2498891 RepID=UPI00273BD9B6|nr:uncharacterized protein LOC131689013 [Topomyia yanbarensis]
MDFIKSLLPPLRMPKLRKLKHWNGGSILNLSQLTSFASRSRHVGTVISTTSTCGGSNVPPRPTISTVTTSTKPGHARKRSEISTISATVPAPKTSTANPGNYGLYALKCDRSAAKRGILLSLPRKISAVSGSCSSSSYHSEVMVHEKFSPCKRTVIEPPPRRKKFRKRLLEMEQQQQQRQREPPTVYLGDRMLERNRSELFRIAERGSQENLDRRRRRASPAPPSAREIASGRRARSADNILARDSDSDEGEDQRQVGSYNVSRDYARYGLQYSSSMESDLDGFGRERQSIARGRFKLASDFSIENSSDKIEVRYHANESTESEEVGKTVPMPTRVMALRQEKVKPRSVTKPVKVEKLPPKKPAAEQFVSSSDFTANFKPLAAVLQESVKSSDLKRKWFNDFLSESDDEPVKCKPTTLVETGQQRSNDLLSKKFALVAKFDKQLEALERGRGQSSSKDSVESVNIFKKSNTDFDEFDRMFDGDVKRRDSIKTKGSANDEFIYINRKSNLGELPPVRTPPRPPYTTVDPLPKSTVQIQDYYDKHLQRVRYVASPSPSRSFDVDNNNLVLPLNVINRTDVGRCYTEPATTTTMTTNQNGLGYYRTYNQSSNDHIPCNLNNNTYSYYTDPITTTTTNGTSMSTTAAVAADASTSNGSGGVFIVGETFKRTQESEVVPRATQIRRYINYKFDDYCHIGGEAVVAAAAMPAPVRNPTPTRTRPLRTFNIYDFHADCYNEEGVVII